jgi:hypothetical protein
MPDTESHSTAVESQVREIVTLLSKAAKNYQVYLPNNRMFLTSLAEAGQALRRYLEENEVLTLAVKEFDLLFDKVPVYSNQDKHQSIAFRMYRDGVRLLSFHQGITDDELTALFEALTRCLECERLEEDFVTLLWEKDLQCITYYEVNDDSDYQGRRGDPVQGTDPEFHPTGSEMTEAEWTEVTRDVEKMLPVLNLTQGDLDEVKNLSLVVEDDEFLKRAWHVLSSTLDICAARETCLDLENAVTGFLDLCVQTRHLGTAAEVLADVRSRLATFPGSDVRAALSRIMESRHNEANMATVGTCLAEDREVGQEQCLAYLTQLSPAALPSVLGLLPKCGDQGSRHVVVMSLAALAKSDPAALAQLAAGKTEQEIDVVLDALTVMGSENALTAAMGLRDHPSPKIRVKVVTLAPRLRNGVATDVAQAMTQDQNPSVRRRALVSLVEIGGERCLHTLLDLFTSKEFILLPRDKKSSMLMVTRNLPAADQRRIIDAIFQMRGWFRRRSIEDTKAAVVEILHLMHGDTVSYFADNLADRAPESLQKAIDLALKKAWRDDNER